MKDIRHVGFDVDSEKIAVAVAEPEGEVRSLGMIPNREESVRRLVKKLGPANRLRVCYEAGPHGYSPERLCPEPMVAMRRCDSAPAGHR